MIKKDVVIIGGGASALLCASAIKGRDVLILEKADRVGKKILVTGNGRCNLTNMSLDVSKYNTDKVSQYFSRFSSMDTIDYFKSLGLMTYSDSEGRVYPVSDTATSVLDVLRLRLIDNGVDTMCSIDVRNISIDEGKYVIDIGTDDIVCDTLILAVGSASGDKYLDSIGIPYIPYRRSLGALVSDKNIGLNGVKADRVKVTLEVNNKKYSQNGEILFKENALSGIVIFNISAYFARENVDSAYVSIDYMPDTIIADLLDILTIRKNQFSDRKISDYLVGLFHKAIATNILSRVGLNMDKKISSITSHDIESLAHTIKEYRVKVYKVSDNNQVYTGGVSLDILDTNLQVKTHPNMYFLGEFIDVDAECGGYNLQWAWTSGYIVAKAVSRG